MTARLQVTALLNTRTHTPPTATRAHTAPPGRRGGCSWGSWGGGDGGGDGGGRTRHSGRAAARARTRGDAPALLPAGGTMICTPTALYYASTLTRRSFRQVGLQIMTIKYVLYPLPPTKRPSFLPAGGGAGASARLHLLPPGSPSDLREPIERDFRQVAVCVRVAVGGPSPGSLTDLSNGSLQRLSPSGGALQRRSLTAPQRLPNGSPTAPQRLSNGSPAAL
jgi:hypothetical protein